MRTADRRYFFAIGLACAIGYSYRLWLLPPVVLAALEGAATVSERLRATVPRPVRLPVRRPGRAAVTHSADRAA